MFYKYFSFFRTTKEEECELPFRANWEKRFPILMSAWVEEESSSIGSSDWFTAVLDSFQAWNTRTKGVKDLIPEGWSWMKQSFTSYQNGGNAFKQPHIGDLQRARKCLTSDGTSPNDFFSTCTALSEHPVTWKILSIQLFRAQASISCWPGSLHPCWAAIKWLDRWISKAHQIVS